MRPIALITFAAGLLFPLFAAAPAEAQASRTWVSGVGEDTAACSRTAPCKTFAAAYSNTAAGGEINCLDPGGYGALTISKSLAISCEAGTAGIVVAGGNAIVVSAAAADEVFLKGLDIEGSGAANQVSLNGIKVISVGLLHIEDCVIRGFKSVAPDGFAIKLVATNSMTFVVNRSTLYNNGLGTTGGGVQVAPVSGVTNGAIEKSVMNRNVNGVVGDGFGGGNGFNVTMAESVISGSSNVGVLVTSVALSSYMVDRSRIVNNGTGLSTQNAGAFIRVGATAITGNGTATSGAGVLSYGDNRINGNGVDTIPGAVPGGVH